MKPTYFDLTVRDLPAAKAFFEAALGWELQEFAPGYLRIKAGPAEEPGIDGGMAAFRDAPLAKGQPMTIVVLPVPDLEDVMRRVEENGGKVVERRTAVRGIGWFSACTEPGGLIFGIMQADPEAR